MLDGNTLKALLEANGVLSALVSSVLTMLDEFTHSGSGLTDDVLHTLDYAVGIASEITEILEAEYAEFGGEKTERTEIRMNDVADAITGIAIASMMIQDMERFSARYRRDPVSAVTIAYSNMETAVSLLDGVRKFV